MYTGTLLYTAMSGVATEIKLMLVLLSSVLLMVEITRMDLPCVAIVIL